MSLTFLLLIVLALAAWHTCMHASSSGGLFRGGFDGSKLKRYYLLTRDGKFILRRLGDFIKSNQRGVPAEIVIDSTGRIRNAIKPFKLLTCSGLAGGWDDIASSTLGWLAPDEDGYVKMISPNVCQMSDLGAFTYLSTSGISRTFGAARKPSAGKFKLVPLKM